MHIFVAERSSVVALRFEYELTANIILIIIVGAGYSVEGQKTGEEKFGGLQLEVTPAYRPDLKLWFRATESLIENCDRFGALDEYTTPATNGLRPGDRLRLHPRPPVESVPFKIRDLVEEFASSNLILNVSRLKKASHTPIRTEHTM